MPLSAKFDADFQSFYDAVAKANVSLNSFEQETADVEARLNRMANSFSGVKVIQDAAAMAAAIDKLGGVSGLTEKELQKVARTASEATQKLTAMGRDVPDNIRALGNELKQTNPLLEGMLNIGRQITTMFAGLFSVQALISFGRAILDTASDAQNLAGALSITTDEAQELQYIAASTSTPINALSGAIQELQERIGSGNKGTTAALNQLGLSVKALSQLSGYQQLQAIAAALREIEDPARQAALGTEIFGGKWKAIAGAVAEDTRKIGDEAPKMSTKTIENLNRMKVAWEQFKITLVAGGGEIIGKMGQVREALNFKGLTETTDEYRNRVLGVTESLAGATAAALKHGATIGTLREETGRATLSEDEYAAVLKESNQELGALNAAQTKFAAAMTELNSVSGSWQQTLNTLNGDMVEAIKYYLEAGVSQGALQEAYGLTAAQVRAVAESLRAEADALRLQQMALNVTSDLWKEYYQIQTELTGTATDIQIAEIERWATETAARMEEAGAATTAFYEGLAKNVEAKMQGVLIDWEAIAGNSADYYQRTLEQTAQKAEATYQYMLSHSEQFSVSTIQQFAEQARAAREAADTWAFSFEAASDQATAAVEKTTRAAKGALETLTQVSKAAAGAVQINTAGITISNMEEAYKKYSAQYGGGMTGGSIGGGPAKDFLSWALEKGYAFKAPTTAGGGNTYNVNMSGMLATTDPQGKAALQQAVGEALVTGMRQSRLMGTA